MHVQRLQRLVDTLLSLPSNAPFSFEAIGVWIASDPWCRRRGARVWEAVFIFQTRHGAHTGIKALAKFFHIDLTTARMIFQAKHYNCERVTRRILALRIREHLGGSVL